MRLSRYEKLWISIGLNSLQTLGCPEVAAFPLLRYVKAQPPADPALGTEIGIAVLATVIEVFETELARQQLQLPLVSFPPQH